MAGEDRRGTPPMLRRLIFNQRVEWFKSIVISAFRGNVQNMNRDGVNERVTIDSDFGSRGAVLQELGR
jgi:hypothetical protein